MNNLNNTNSSPKFNTEINNALLVEEVKKRPELYDKKAMGYVDRTGIKPDRWLEVAESVYDDKYWSQMKYAEKVKATHALQSRWQALRNVFAKSLKIRFDKNGQPIQHRTESKTPALYENMMFLFQCYYPDKYDEEKPEDDEESISLNRNNVVKPRITYSKRQSDSGIGHVLKKPKVEVVEENTVTVKQEPCTDLAEPVNGESSTACKEFFQADSFKIEQNAVKQEIVDEVIQIEDDEHEQLLENSSEPKDYITEMLNVNPDTIDQDVNFALYLIPMLRNLPIKKKLKIQIQILKLFEDN